MSKKLIILSKDACPGCQALKITMAMTRGKYDDFIISYKKEDQVDEYNYWVEKSKTKMVPTLIIVDENEEILDIQRGHDHNKILQFLKDNLDDAQPDVPEIGEQMRSSLKLVTKRDGSIVDYDSERIVRAITKAGEETGELTEETARELLPEVERRLLYIPKLHVEAIQDEIEDVLLDNQYKETSKAYMLYRTLMERSRSRDIFRKRINLKPYEYPELYEYVDAIRHSYWIHTEFNYTSDIQDYHTNVSDAERNAIKNAMLAIAQVEVAVKTFWGDLYKRMPKPELGSVGFTFAESEVRHHDAYSHLLELLGLNEEFETINEIPALMNRVKYLDNSVATANTESDRDYMLSVLLFSLFIEHVSLFSQFLIIMSFNKYKNLFKGVSNVIEATSKEEQIHGLFGIDIINIVREEHPEWFDKEMEETVYAAVQEAYDAEEEVIDWIFEAGELDFLPADVVKEFVKNRFNNSLDSIGYERLFDVDEDMVIETDWFDDEVVATKHVDFFVKRSINYSKRTKSITSDDLF